MTFVDPLVSGDIDLTVVLIVIGKTIATFALLLVAVLFSSTPGPSRSRASTASLTESARRLRRG